MIMFYDIFIVAWCSLQAAAATPAPVWTRHGWKLAACSLLGPTALPSSRAALALIAAIARRDVAGTEPGGKRRRETAGQRLDCLTAGNVRDEFPGGLIETLDIHGLLP